jgi:hypothetical protein
MDPDKKKTEPDSIAMLGGAIIFGIIGWVWLSRIVVACQTTS